jgi:hypothetical protein
LAGAIETAGCEPLVTSVGSWQFDSGKAPLDSGSGRPDTGAGPADVGPDAPSAGASFYIEAELGRLDGFSVGDDNTASGGRFLAAPAGLVSEDQPGTATARYDIDIVNTGDYLIWARFRTRDWQHNRIWAAVDGGAWTKWRSTTGDIWYWYFIHPDLEYHTPVVFAGLLPGHHELVLANCTDGVEIDRLYITSLGEGDRPPGDSSTCQLQPPDAIPMGGQCVPSCGAQVGNTCEPDLCAGKDLKEAYDCSICCYVGD